MKNQKKNLEEKNLETFNVLITEVSSRIVEVEAKDSNEAITKVSELYYNQEIILDDSDFDDTEFSIFY